MNRHIDPTRFIIEALLLLVFLWYLRRRRRARLAAGLPVSTMSGQIGWLLRAMVLFPLALLLVPMRGFAMPFIAMRAMQKALTRR